MIIPFDTKDCLYFHHIPKTGGWTLHGVLCQYFDDHEVCPARLWKQLITMPSEELSTYRLFSGHFYYTVYDMLPSRPYTITMLRDPVQRMISHFQHIVREPSLFHHQQAVERGIDGFFSQPEIQKSLRNVQTRMLALELDVQAIQDSWGKEIFDAYRLGEFHAWLELPVELSDKDLLRLAKERLESFAWFGITDHFEDSLKLLTHTFGWPPLVEYDIQNTAPTQLRVDSISPHTISILKWLTELDQQLFAYAQQLFDRRLEEISVNRVNLTQSLNILSGTNHLLEETYTTMPNERVIEIPWALSQLPQRGVILDVGSCEATYLSNIVNTDRELHCLDPRPCLETVAGLTFYNESLLGNTLPSRQFDAILVLSTLEHIGLPHYDQDPMPQADNLAIAEIARLLKPGGKAILTMPIGLSKVASWYRQYSIADLERLFSGWNVEMAYWTRANNQYVQVTADEIAEQDYISGQGAGALAGIVAYPKH
jgi:SAM-dependent methyltransferase